MKYFRYLASGDSMKSMTFQYLMGKTTICNIIHETCTTIWDCLCPSVLPPVLSEEEWIELAQDFQEVTNFIHCIGAIDGKHIVIQVRIYVIFILFVQLYTWYNYWEIDNAREGHTL